MKKTVLTWGHIDAAISALNLKNQKVYGVPKGGMIVAGLAKQKFPGIKLIMDPWETKPDLILDDLIDSGATRDKYQTEYPNKEFIALFDKQKMGTKDWLVFPWEAEHPAGEDSVEQNIVRQLEYIGEDPNREGLLDTPKRIVKSWDELFAGYNQDPKELLRHFDAETYDQIVLLKDIELYSMCVAGSTFVETPKGRISISRLKEGEWIYCYDEENNKITLAQASNPRVTGKNKRLYRVYSDKDTILCTGTHKFLTYEKGWVEAKNLTPGDSIVSLNKGCVLTNGIPRAYLTMPDAKQTSESRYVFQEINGPIDKKIHVHHIDKRPNNNDPTNLTSLSIDKHFRFHRKEETSTGFANFTEQQRSDMKEKQIAGIKRSQTKETRKKRAKSVKKYWDSLSGPQRKARNHKILMVEKTDWYEDVWCMEVPKYHNFVANGMVVHNCEHHMLPFLGKAHVAYIPNGRVLGISKLARLVDIYARRLQIQERIGERVTDFLMEECQAKGAACIIEAQHLCMRMRGCSKQNSTMVTSSLKGVFFDLPEARQELMQLIRN